MFDCTRILIFQNVVSFGSEQVITVEFVDKFHQLTQITFEDTVNELTLRFTSKIS